MSAIVHSATLTHIYRTGDAHIVRCTFDGSAVHDTRFRASWPLKKYVMEAMKRANLTPAWNLTYSWAES